MSQPGGRDLTRNSYNRPAFGEFENINAVGHHVIRNNIIRRCGQAGIFAFLHGTLSDIYDNQVEDINSAGLFSADDASGIRLAVAVDATVRNNLVRRVRGAGVMLGPLYQGTRVTANVIMDIQGNPMSFFRSHGLALIDKNIVIGSASGNNGIKLRSAEANVFVQNLFADCSFSSEPLPANAASGTISYRPHSLVTKQTIPATAVDNKWFANIFIRGGLDKLAKQYNTEADYNAYLGAASKTTWGDEHSKSVTGNGGFTIKSTTSTVDIIFDLSACPKIDVPIIDTDFIGRFALSEGVEWPDGRPVKLNTDYFGNTAPAMVGPFIKYQDLNTKTARLFERITKKEVTK